MPDKVTKHGMSMLTPKMFFDNSVTMSPYLLAALAFSESSFNPDAVSSVGAQGLMQFMPGTWQQWAPNEASAFDPEVSIRTADAYLAWLENNTDSLRESLVAYMWGVGNLHRRGYDNAPDVVKAKANMIVDISEMLELWENMPDGKD